MTGKSEPPPEHAPLFCGRCAAELTPGTGTFYIVTIEAVADPTPPEVDTEEMEGDLGEKIRQIIGQMEGMSEREALDQVYRRLVLHLCVPCYRRWIENPTG